MSDEPKKSPAEIMAELVAKKAASHGQHGPGGLGRKQTERAAAAQAASKSRPALRKS